MTGRLVGVVGYAQHGKDSVGRMLVEQHGFVRYAFADQLKSMAFVLNPIVQTYQFPKHPERLQTLVSLLGWDKAKEIGEVRRFLQVLGTEAVRDHLGENSWVDALGKKMQDDLAWVWDSADENEWWWNKNVVVTDVRFPNEAEWIRQMDGELWRVERVVRETISIRDGVDPGREELEVPFDNGLGTDHPSERYVKDLPFDRLLVAADLDELKAQVDAIGGQIGL
jgi:hypothetical protein